MPRLIVSACAAALALAGGAANAKVQVSADPACKVIRILPNGKRVVTPASRAHRQHGPAYASAASSGEGSSSSSVSASSSSSGGGYATASSTTSSRGRSQTVTTTHDDNGCTVVIDRRRGARR
jgi:uncharacterized membrane protein YgcG